MAVRCVVVRGLVKEVEEEINKFLSTCPVRVLHMAQSETRDQVAVTLLFEDPTSEDGGSYTEGPREERQ